MWHTQSTRALTTRAPWAEHIGRVCAWAKGHKVMPGLRPVGAYLDDPEETPTGKCRSGTAVASRGTARPSCT